MVLLNSDSDTAASHATSISQGGAQLLGIGKASKDGETTLQGNRNASTAIDLDETQSNEIATALHSFMTIINGMASEFESTDMTLSSMMVLERNGSDFLSQNGAALPPNPTFSPNPSLFR